jgi:hypothetical protein
MTWFVLPGHNARTVWLHQKCPRLGSSLVINRTALSGLVLLVIAFLFSACASTTDEATTGESSSQSSAAVPGEKMSDEGRLTPGAPGSSASVHW